MMSIMTEHYSSSVNRMNCERCGKRLSKKSARLINNRVVCGVCMWKPTLARDSDATRRATVRA
jgi:formylmethanofuran dehydrogenase subunit E